MADINNDQVNEQQNVLNQGQNAPQNVQAPRVPRTHKPNLIEALKKLSLVNKLIKNKAIESENEARELKTLNHLSDPVAHPDPGSEIASLITIEEEDKNRLKVPSFFASVSDYVYTSLAKWLADEEEVDREDKVKSKRKAEDKLTSEESRINKRRCVDGSLMVPRPKGRSSPLQHPQIMFDTENHRSIPMGFHLNKNIQVITEEAATLPMVKANPLPGESKGMYILDIAKLTDRFSKDQDLTCSQWMEAAENFFRFQQQRDKDGNQGAHSQFYDQHFSFFNEQIKRDELYPAWAPLELELRQAHVTKNELFDIDLYERRFAICEQTYIMKQELIQKFGDPKNRSGSRDNGSQAGSSSRSSGYRRPFDRGDRSNQPFSPGSGRPSSTSTCLICAERGHSSHTHSDSTTPIKFADGKLTWAKSTPRGLCTPDGRRICVGWNAKGDRAVCYHRDDSVHQCSFCGSKNHHAFAWSCRSNTSPN